MSKVPVIKSYAGLSVDFVGSILSSWFLNFWFWYDFCKNLNLLNKKVEVYFSSENLVCGLFLLDFLLAEIKSVIFVGKAYNEHICLRIWWVEVQGSGSKNQTLSNEFCELIEDELFEALASLPLADSDVMLPDLEDGNIIVMETRAAILKVLEINRQHSKVAYYHLM